MSKIMNNPASLEEIAADWWLRSDRGLKPAEERELAGWLAADARHEAAFLAMEETWHRLGTAKTESFRVPEPVVVRPRKWRMPLSLAAAAAVTAGAFLGWHTWRTNYAPYELTAQTDIGGLRELDLPDGSVLHLNTDTRVDVLYEKGERRVALLQGEAHFTVAKNKTRPFVVSAGGVDVRAVGTAFNVRLRDTAVEVLVTEGRVALGNSESKTENGVKPDPQVSGLRSQVSEMSQVSTTTLLSAGERATVARVPAEPTLPVEVPVVAPVTPAAVRQALAWQEKRLDFDGTPLGEMIEEINRYSKEKLVIEDPLLRGELFGGSFPAGDTDTVVRMLVGNFDVVAEKSGMVTTLRLRPKKNP